MWAESWVSHGPPTLLGSPDLNSGWQYTLVGRWLLFGGAGRTLELARLAMKPERLKIEDREDMKMTWHIKFVACLIDVLNNYVGTLVLGVFTPWHASEVFYDQLYSVLNVVDWGFSSALICTVLIFVGHLCEPDIVVSLPHLLTFLELWRNLGEWHSTGETNVIGIPAH